MKYRCAVLAILFIVPWTLQSTTYRVGPSRQYPSLQQVTNLLLPGDTVLVDGDTTYAGGIVFSRPGSISSRILIRGIRINGRRPVINGGTNGVAFTTGPPSADHYTFEGFEVSNATFRGVYHQADDLILRDLVIHNCNNGLMGADNGSGTLLLEYCEFYQCGSGTGAHQIYMATDESTHPGSVFRMQFCFVHDGTGGNNVKSRAERNEIYYNWIEGAVYHELELIGPDPAGGVPAGLKREDSDVVGNVLWKRATSYGSAGTFFVSRFGGDGTGESKGRYRVVNNTVLMGTSAVFRLFDGLESVEMHNNVFTTLSGTPAPIIRTAEAVWTAGERISGQNNWVRSGLTTLPAGWTGTVTGPDPGFRDVATNDLTPAAGSPLINAGTSTPLPPAGDGFPSPLFPPASLPPQHMLNSPGAASVRPAFGIIDIGAYEYLPGVSVAEEPPIPAFRLEQNYPNPFNSSSDIRYLISDIGMVRLAVYDILGREVAVLVNEKKEPGSYRVTFDAAGLASGVYLYRLRTGERDLTRTMVLTR
jgi:hypothetical protein